MNDENQGVKEVSEVVAPSVSPADENNKDFYSDIPEPSESAQTPEAEGTEEESPTESNKGANARIRELAAQKNAEKQRADSLAKQVEELTNAGSQYDLGPIKPYDSNEVTAEEVEARAVQKAVALSQLQFQRQQMVQRVQREALEAISEHPQLDPDNEAFDQDLSDSITEASLAYVSANPGKSLKAYVGKLMKPYKRSLEKSVGELADTVTRQAAEKALRPTSTPKGEKRPEDMSEKELEKKLGTVY